MVKKSDKNPGPADPETEEKKRLRALALSRKILRRAPANPAAALEPSRGVVKLDGRDIVKRGQRKSRYLFSFPGLLAPLSGGRVGELADLSTRNPVLYLEYPQGRMKLFGTHVYPKNKYLSLQLTKSSKGVVCEDCFDSMIVFSDAWWIGLKEENPDEHRLEFPKDLTEGKHTECDFKGGAGATLEETLGGNRPVKEYTEPLSPDIKVKDDMSEDSNPITTVDENNVMEATPVRQSARAARKPLNYAESSAEDDSVSAETQVSEEMDTKVVVRSDNATRRSIFGKIEDTSPATSSHIADEFALVEGTHSTPKLEHSSLSLKKSEGDNPVKGMLVQATLSTLFEKVVEKKPKRSPSKSPGSKGSAIKRQVSKKQLTDKAQVKESTKKPARASGKKGGGRTKLSLKRSEVEDDEPEEISSESQDDSDEDWAA